MKRLCLAAIIIISCFALNVVEAAELRIKVWSIFDSEITYKYDQKRISEKILRKYIEINPSYHNPFLLIAPQLELCIANDPRYYPCYSRNIHDKNFFKNSLVNINIAKGSLQYLHELNEIKELKSLVDYFIDSLSFSLWLNESRYQFYQTWDTSHLKKTYKNLDPFKICPDIVQQIENSTDINQKYELAKYKWHNALNNEYRENVNEDSLKRIWSDFLKHYQIKEKVISLGEP
jgi:hypothetical protein